MRGMVFDIQRFSLHDGPGIRTTVFLKGCPLRCPWCHNPEGVRRGPQLSFAADRCVGCGYCFRRCPRQAHAMVGDRHALDREKCQVCGSCTDQCAGGALEMVGREMSADQVLAVVERDRPFYAHSGGGLTLSGGEPTFQIDFAEALLRQAQAAGLHRAVETCGYCAAAAMDRLAPLADLFLFDLKHTEDARHQALTGVPNGPILANLRRLHAAGAAVVLRLPLIPGVNDEPAHLDGLARLAAELPRLRSAEVLPYHPLGTGKVERLGGGMEGDRTEPFRAATPAAETVARWVQRLRQAGLAVPDPIGYLAPRPTPG